LDAEAITFRSPLVAGCSIGRKPHPLHVLEWEVNQIKKKSNYTSNNFSHKDGFCHFRSFLSRLTDCRSMSGTVAPPWDQYRKR